MVVNRDHRMIIFCAVLINHTHGSVINRSLHSTNFSTEIVAMENVSMENVSTENVSTENVSTEIVSMDIAQLLEYDEFKCDSDWEHWCTCQENNYPNNCSGASSPSFYHRCNDSPATQVLLEEGTYRSDYIYCCALNYSSITWYERTVNSKDTWQPLALVDGRKLVDNNQSLQVYGRKTSEGRYRCVVDNTQTNQSINLTVRLLLTANPKCHEAPTIPGPNHTTLHRFPGEHFEYECSADIGECDERLTSCLMYWVFSYKNDSRPIDNTENVYSVQGNTSVNNSIRLTSTLYVKSVSNINYGNYTCVVAHLLGINNSTVTLAYGCDVCKKYVFIGQAAGVALTSLSAMVLVIFLVLSTLMFTHRWDLNVKNWYYSKLAHKADKETKFLVVTNDDEDDDDRDSFCFAQHFKSKLREIISADCKDTKQGDPENENVQEPLQEHEYCKHFSVQLLKVKLGEDRFSVFETAAAENDFVIYLVSERDLQPSNPTRLHTFFELDVANRFIGSIFVTYKCNVKEFTTDNHINTGIVRALKYAVKANSFTNFALHWPGEQNDHILNCQEENCTESSAKSRKQRMFWKQVKYKIMKGRKQEVRNNDQLETLNGVNNTQNDVNHRDQNENEVNHRYQSELNNGDQNEPGLNRADDVPPSMQRSAYRPQKSGGSASSSRPLLSQTSTDSGAEVNAGEVLYPGGPDAQLQAITEDVFSQ